MATTKRVPPLLDRESLESSSGVKLSRNAAEWRSGTSMQAEGGTQRARTARISLQRSDFQVIRVTRSA